MNKEVDLLKVALQLGGIRLALPSILGEVWDRLPEKDGGFPSVKSDFVGLGLQLFDKELLPAIGDYTNGDLDVDNLPVPEPDPDPVDPDPQGSNTIRIMNTGAEMRWNGYPYDKFVFPKPGPEYTDEPFDLVFEDGEKLFVPDPHKMWMTPQNKKYQPGAEWSGNNPDMPTMEVYAKKDTHPKWVEARFRHVVDDTPYVPPVTPPGPVDDGWTTVDWGGNPNETSEGRSRLHWTRIHGGSESRWWRKFPLPQWLDDKSYAVDFIFSSGKRFHVTDSMKMAMEDDNGPKYRHQDGNQEPNKNHPKISEEYGRNETWVKFRAR